MSNSFSELLIKHENPKLNSLLDDMVSKSSIFNFVKIEENNEGYVVEATNFFYIHTGASYTKIYLNKDLSMEDSMCECLAFHKNEVCLHTIILFGIALIKIDNDEFKKQKSLYESFVERRKNSIALNSLTDSLKKNNLFYNLIHLVPVIEEVDNKYDLSLRIGYDKYYVVKSINEFLINVDNNIECSYGKKLSFVHSFECLDQTSKDLYSFLVNIKTDEAEKSIRIKKSHVLSILELYKDQVIFYKTKNEDKASERIISEIKDINIVLDSKKLYISHDLNRLLLGVNNAYFIDDNNIYYYQYKSRVENKILDVLFPLNGELNIEASSDAFISNLLPMIKNSIVIKEDFYDKYPIPNVGIDTYLLYEGGAIILEYKLSCSKEEENSPYIKQEINNYINVIETYDFKVNKEGKYYIKGIDEQYKFLTSDLSSLKALGNIYFDDSMSKIKVKKTAKTSIRVSFNVGLLDFKFENSQLTQEDIIEMLKAYHQKKKFVKLKDDSILEINEEDAKEIDDFLEDFNININDLDDEISKPLNYILKIIDAKDDNVVVDDKVFEIMEDIRNYKTANYIATDNFKNNLREYQYEGFRWLKTLSSYNFGGILADDMGLGKTIQVLSLLDSDEAKKPSLIVCPMSLVYNWENECDKWKLGCKCHVITGLANERLEIIKLINNKEKALFVTSYDSLRRDVEFYKSFKFRFIIADEAQVIKNQFTQKSEAIKSLKSDVNFALTGTPIENGLADLWSIFDYLMPGYLSKYSHFRSRYEDLILHDDTEALTKLKRRVEPFILRRDKKTVLKDLPDKFEDYLYCKMEPKQREIYDAYVEKLKDDLKNGGDNVLALITRLRQVCITPELIYQEPFENTKINMAIDMIKSQIEGGHRILLFSQFSHSFPILSKELDKMNIKHFTIDGTTKARNRIDMVDEFNSNTDIKVFLISLKAGGTGLNLTGADVVIHLDPWWNSSAENQATDRAYRIGQTKDVYVIKIICKDTIEEKVVKLQNLKKELASSIVNSEDSTHKLTKEEILELLDEE